MKKKEKRILSPPVKSSRWESCCGLLLPGRQIPVDEAPLLQIGHAAGHLHRILAQSVDQHGALWLDAPQALQQGTKRRQLSHLAHVARARERARERDEWLRKVS